MKKKMNIVIAGCGRVGAELAQQLSEEKHSVTVVDTDAKRLSDASGLYDMLGVTGNCAARHVLEEAGVAEADLMIAATGSDEQNLLACLLAKNLHAKHTIARVSDPDYAEQMELLRDDLRLSMYVNPEYAAAAELFRSLRFPSAENIEVFSGGQAEIVEFPVPPNSIVVGKTLREVNELSGAHILVCSVMRNGLAYIPKGGFRLQAGDLIGVTGKPVNVNKAFRKLELPFAPMKKVILVGGGNISYYLAKMLIGIKAEPHIVERDEARCRELNELLPEAVIHCGEGSDRELLGEIGVTGADGFCALTGSDEENIVLGMYVDSLNAVDRVVVQINSGTLAQLAKNTGLKSTISPKHITADLILQYVRGMSNSQDISAEALHLLCDGKAEALEFIASTSVVDRVVDVPLKELKLREDVLIAAVIRGKDIIIPDGNSRIGRGDHVLVVTTSKDIREIQNILA